MCVASASMYYIVDCCRLSANEISRRIELPGNPIVQRSCGECDVEGGSQDAAK